MCFCRVSLQRECVFSLSEVKAIKILIVEDEPGLREALVDLLTGAGHVVEAVADGIVAVERGVDSSFDLILLDLMLPGKSGLDVCLDLRRERPGLYILMLTARGSEDDKVKGLGVGADDYVTKPFGARELLARIESIERRLQTIGTDGEEIEVSGCRINLGRCFAVREGKECTLTGREVGILRLLYQHRERAVSRSELLEKVWNAPGDLTTRTVDMTIANLRQKIEQNPSDPEIVLTIKGVGYAWTSS